MDSINIQFSTSKAFKEFYSDMKRKYPEFLDVDGIGEDQLDFTKFREAFFGANTAADVSVDANANVDSNDVVSYGFECRKPFFRLDNYSTMFDLIADDEGVDEARRLLEKNILGAYYINDFSGDLRLPYCFNYSCMDLHYNGLSTVTKILSVPPKHIMAFFGQLEQFIGIASNNTHGATGIADVLIILSWYVKKALETKKDASFEFKSKQDVWNYVTEYLTSFVYTINQPLFRANQSPFTNISVYDDFFLRDLCKDYYFSDGSNPDIKIVKKLQDILIDIKNNEMERTPITFPVITACFTRDETGGHADKTFQKKIANASVKFAAFEIYTGDTSTLSSCCRLRSDTKNQFFNSFGAGSSKIGSMGVVTVNLPQSAYIAKNLSNDGDADSIWRIFKSLVNDMQNNAAIINNCKRKLIAESIENKSLPLYSHGFMALNKQYSTMGINGLNEALEIIGYDIMTDDGQAMVKDLMAMIKETCNEHENRYGFPHNCEQTPSENSAIKLATKDRMLGYNDKYTFYSNQFIPLIKKADMMDRIILQGMFDNDFSGGSISHLNFASRPSVDAMVDLMNVCSENGVIYFAPCFEYNFCKNRHASIGPHSVCPICGKKVDKYMKVVGFQTKVDNWAKTRREDDFPNRQKY